MVTVDLPISEPPQDPCMFVGEAGSDRERRTKVCKQVYFVGEQGRPGGKERRVQSGSVGICVSCIYWHGELELVQLRLRRKAQP